MQVQHTPADHIAVQFDASARSPGSSQGLLVRCDGAGASHELVDWLSEQGKGRGRSLEYPVGFSITEKSAAIRLVPEHVWSTAIDADGDLRGGGDAAELTGLLDLSGWPWQDA